MLTGAEQFLNKRVRKQRSRKKLPNGNQRTPQRRAGTGRKQMKLSNLILGLGLLTVSAALAQGPMYDKVTVNLPYAVTVNGTVLQPGEYVIRQHEDAGGGSRVLHFFSDGGMKLETTAMAIPALDNRTPEQTKLVLDHIGSEYYLNKIWVQGKDYGYEFPIPPNIRMREQERNAPATVAAQYTPAPEPAPAPVVAEEKKEETTVVAQNTPPPPAPAPAPEVAPAPEPAPAPRVQAEQAPEPAMPHTAANWMNLVLGGGLLAASGFALRRAQA
jgi:hypothetical protein